MKTGGKYNRKELSVLQIYIQYTVYVVARFSPQIVLGVNHRIINDRMENSIKGRGIGDNLR